MSPALIFDQDTENTVQHNDVVVVGAGPAGLMLA